jgi:hypothetical protein
MVMSFIYTLIQSVFLIVAIKQAEPGAVKQHVYFGQRSAIN